MKWVLSIVLALVVVSGLAAAKLINDSRITRETTGDPVDGVVIGVSDGVELIRAVGN